MSKLNLSHSRLETRTWKRMKRITQDITEIENDLLKDLNVVLEENRNDKEKAVEKLQLLAKRQRTFAKLEADYYESLELLYL